MKTDPGRNDLPPTTDRTAETGTEDEALWAVLGRAQRPVSPSPYFTRRVLREVALLEEAEPAWQRWLGGLLAGRRLGVAAGATCALLLTAASVGLLPSRAARRAHRRAALSSPALPAISGVSPVPAAVDESLSEKDLRVIADLDETLDSEENGVWLDDDNSAS